MNTHQIEWLDSNSDLSPWNKFVDNSPQGSVFCRSWWLDAIAPQQYKIITLKENNIIIAGMPLVFKNKWYGKTIVMPVLTQVHGILFQQYLGSSIQKKLSQEIHFSEIIIKAIPAVNNFSIAFHYNYTNWLPFYWAGYQQTTRYTYVIEDISDPDVTISQFNHSKRKNIKKALKLVTVNDDMSPEEFYTHHQMTLNKKVQIISYNLKTFLNIYNAAKKNNCGKIWYASDEQNNIHAAIFVIHDNHAAYFLISSIDPDFKHSQATTLLIHDAIKYLSKFTSRFDFEGSMIRKVESSFRKFGAVQKPYFLISNHSRFLSILKSTKNIINSVIGK